MLVRILTGREILELKPGHVVLGAPGAMSEYFSDGQSIPDPISCTRVAQPFDDADSSGFWVEGTGDWFYLSEGEVYVKEAEPAYDTQVIVDGCPSHQIELGVYRPELETRKVGKIRVELVDDGFPLALREVAKVMTWAQTAKGYKDHDWQNLPNAEIALAAAASRHRTDHIKQRVVDDYAIEDCVDPESALLHKAHEAFGVLAQLELMLRGDIA